MSIHEAKSSPLLKQLQAEYLVCHDFFDPTVRQQVRGLDTSKPMHVRVKWDEIKQLSKRLKKIFESDQTIQELTLNASDSGLNFVFVVETHQQPCLFDLAKEGCHLTTVKVHRLGWAIATVYSRMHNTAYDITVTDFLFDSRLRRKFSDEIALVFGSRNVLNLSLDLKETSACEEIVS